MRQTYLAFAVGAALALSGCFGGSKTPPTLMTLSPVQEPPAQTTRTVGEGEAITVAVPIVSRALETVRVPVHQSEIAIAYLKNAQWVEPPAALFARLVGDTIAATTGRVVLNAKQFVVDPGTRLTGTLDRFGLDATRMEVVAVYEAVLARKGGGVTTRRFERRVPVAAAEAELVAPALNVAANQVAADVAAWVSR